MQIAATAFGPTLYRIHLFVASIWECHIELRHITVTRTTLTAMDGGYPCEATNPLKPIAIPGCAGTLRVDDPFQPENSRDSPHNA
jgi:hypothetical protein